ncbi:hypothetical protein ABFS82_08G041100 [Erythranthe guttata]|uniref:calcium uniporter protein 2, mitochondrial-like n=1 Tax=Erythranthe guttata TaxID=4155 RepID=UPI00064DB795|nr:PREDICTED: calcium uniporter protein 2, mitochondrial-like [Erythranthe guttata]|eukprot:XP_012852590.1 PREDICTED: calcium uniporter protein 2, mitochondrial-like [Erythranthe guttata]
MAFKQTLAQRVFSMSRISTPAVTNCRVSSPCTAAQSKALNHRTTPTKLAPDPGDDGIFRRHLHHNSAAAPPPPGMRFLPTGEKLLEKLREMDIARDRFRLDSLTPAEPAAAPPPTVGSLTVKDAVKILRISQLETVKLRLRQIEKDCVSYSEFLEICGQDCSSTDQRLEFAKILDQSGSVIVLGNIVFLKPEKVIKAIQAIMPETNPIKMKEFQEMEKQKQAIDEKAKLLVHRELNFGLGYLCVQTAAFMRLTFWELSWDVMEPICFYVTSMYFMGAYVFFLRTAKEPSFEGFYQSRFHSKQKRLIEAENFDIKKYNELKKACYSYSPAHRENGVGFNSSVIL